MELDKTIAAISVCIVIGFCALTTTIILGQRSSNEHYYRTAGECIAKGGTWVPMNHGLCVASR